MRRSGLLILLVVLTALLSGCLMFGASSGSGGTNIRTGVSTSW